MPGFQTTYQYLQQGVQATDTMYSKPVLEKQAQPISQVGIPQQDLTYTRPMYAQVSSSTMGRQVPETYNYQQTYLNPIHDIQERIVPTTQTQGIVYEQQDVTIPTRLQNLQPTTTTENKPGLLQRISDKFHHKQEERHERQIQEIQQTIKQEKKSKRKHQVEGAKHLIQGALVERQIKKKEKKLHKLKHHTSSSSCSSSEDEGIAQKAKRKYKELKSSQREQQSHREQEGHGESKRDRARDLIEKVLEIVTLLYSDEKYASESRGPQDLMTKAMEIINLLSIKKSTQTSDISQTQMIEGQQMESQHVGFKDKLKEKALEKLQEMKNKPSENEQAGQTTEVQQTGGKKEIIKQAAKEAAIKMIESKLTEKAVGKQTEQQQVQDKSKAVVTTTSSVPAYYYMNMHPPHPDFYTMIDSRRKAEAQSQISDTQQITQQQQGISTEALQKQGVTVTHLQDGGVILHNPPIVIQETLQPQTFQGQYTQGDQYNYQQQTQSYQQGQTTEEQRGLKEKVVEKGKEMLQKQIQGGQSQQTQDQTQQQMLTQTQTGDKNIKEQIVDVIKQKGLENIQEKLSRRDQQQGYQEQQKYQEKTSSSDSSSSSEEEQQQQKQGITQKIKEKGKQMIKEKIEQRQQGQYTQQEMQQQQGGFIEKIKQKGMEKLGEKVGVQGERVGVQGERAGMQSMQREQFEMDVKAYGGVDMFDTTEQIIDEAQRRLIESIEMAKVNHYQKRAIQYEIVAQEYRKKAALAREQALSRISQQSGIYQNQSQLNQQLQMGALEQHMKVYHPDLYTGEELSVHNTAADYVHRHEKLNPMPIYGQPESYIVEQQYRPSYNQQQQMQPVQQV